MTRDPGEEWGLEDYRELRDLDPHLSRRPIPAVERLIEDELARRRPPLSVPMFADPGARPRPLDPAIVEQLAKVTKAASEALDRQVLGQLDAVAEPLPPARDIVADVRRALGTIDQARRTVVTSPADAELVRQGLAEFPLVTVVVSSLIDPGTLYVVAAGTMRLDADGTLLRVVDGEPVTADPRSIVRITDIN